MKKTRRVFLSEFGFYAGALGMMSTLPLVGCNTTSKMTDAKSGKPGEMFFKISLAQWSLHKALFAKKMDNLDFAAKAKNDFGIDGLEYVNQFFADKATDKAYLKEMKKRALIFLKWMIIYNLKTEFIELVKIKNVIL